MGKGVESKNKSKAGRETKKRANGQSRNKTEIKRKKKLEKCMVKV